MDKKQMNDRDRPIGIFDSGMGGLTVLKAVRNRLPGENIVYFGDTAHLPYGNKSPDSVTKYSLAAESFLKAKNIKLMIVACNTASVSALAELEKEADFPVIGVVEAGVSAAVAGAESSIGVIGTYGTIKSGAYESRIREKNSGLKIVSKACPLFVPLVEEGWTEHPVTREVAREYLGEFKGKIDSIILACTHYPLLKNVIAEVLGNTVNIVDSAVETALYAEKRLVEMDMLAAASGGRTEYYVSDAPENFQERGRIFTKGRIESVGLVEID